MDVEHRLQQRCPEQQSSDSLTAFSTPCLQKIRLSTGMYYFASITCSNSSAELQTRFSQCNVGHIRCLSLAHPRLLTSSKHLDEKLVRYICFAFALSIKPSLLFALWTLAFNPVWVRTRSKLCRQWTAYRPLTDMRTAYECRRP